jgi:FkbM family methyltransferase
MRSAAQYQSLRRSLIAVVKQLRGFEPLNRALTSSVRGLMRAFGVRDDFAVKHLPRVGTTRSTLPNGSTVLLRSRGDDWISNQIFWRGWDGYEPETTPLFWRLATQAAVTIDIGAHVGFHSILAALANPTATVYAFEPLPPVFERLEGNVRLNKLGNVVAVRAAVGAVDGDAEFFHVPGIIPSSSSLSADFMRGTPGLASASVPVIRVDSFVDEQRLDRVDLVKIDTETGEADALSGMRETLRTCRPDIVCEVLTRGDGDAITSLLEPLDYRFYLLTDDGPVPRPKVVGDPDWLNYLFTARGSV